MENNDHQQPSLTSENPNHQQRSAVSISSPEEHRDLVQVQVTSSEIAAAHSSTRLYECSFCKKGFSNAQALGGHMNIHRKDKAKLKQAANSSKENSGQRKMTIPLTPSNPSSSAAHEDHHILHHQHHHLHHKLSYESQVALAELKQLPLFVETAGTYYRNVQYYSTDHEHQSVGNQRHQTWEESRSASHQELDLELRLGLHEPRSKPAVALGTRKFF